MKKHLINVWGIRLFLCIFFLSLGVLFAREDVSVQDIDKEYTRLIREATTKPEFLSPLTDYLPKAEGVPTPKDVLGYIAGAPGKLTYYSDIVKYMNTLTDASPRVRVFPIGKTSEGREMIIVAVADEGTMSDLQRYKDLVGKLADPRQVQTEKEANALIAQAKPIYWLTGNLHSPETGAAECAMELAYRLAVDENPTVKTIRENMIVLISPSIEPDGHDKHTDWFYKYNRDVADYRKISSVPFWGKYTYHDNNRDMISISQPETMNEVKAFFEWHPVVVQDNHESVPFLYVMSGTGPYNTTYDPSLTSEWNLIAWWEVTRLTSFGMPGVWTHGFWDGWAPNYFFSVANNHNALGRFYETFGNAIGNTLQRDLTEDRFGSTKKEWFRPIPTYKDVLWSMRNNINYQQSADLAAFYFVASNKDYFLKNFWERGTKALELGQKTPPYAFMVPADQKDPVDTAYLINVLLKQRIEVHRSTGPLSIGDAKYPQGSYVIRMDQPYRNLVLNLLGIQKYPEDAPRSYDDTGWTLGLHMDVETIAVDDKAILDAEMAPVTFPVRAEGTVAGSEAKGAYLIENRTVNNMFVARLRLKDFTVLAAEKPFDAAGRGFPAGSMIIPVGEASSDVHRILQDLTAELGLKVFGCNTVPDVATHELDLPRIAIYHTWFSTQDDGWTRFAFDQLGIPFDMIHKTHLRKGGLKDKYDVIVFSNCRGRKGADIVNGIDPARRGPLAFVKSDAFKHLGTPDSCSDITGGMGLEGIVNLGKFVEEGGLLILLHNPVRVAVDYGLLRGIDISRPGSSFYNPGSLLRGEVASESHPVVYGYGKHPVIYRSHSGPLLEVTEEMERHVVLKYAQEEPLCLSGILTGTEDIKGKAAIVDVPKGAGHILLFTFNPFWRDLSRGNYWFVFNAILNYNDLALED